MTYKLKFLKIALKEWKKLPPQIKEQFRKKLEERLKNPEVPASRLHGFTHHYKIKLRATGYRLVYEVIHKEICVLVIGIGKREGGVIYELIKSRAS